MYYKDGFAYLLKLTFNGYIYNYNLTTSTYTVIDVPNMDYILGKGYMADLNNSGNYQFIFLSKNSQEIYLNLMENNQFEQIFISNSSSSLFLAKSSISLVDVNNDSFLEIIVKTGLGLYCLDKDLNFLFSNSNNMIDLKLPVMSGDIDNDFHDEILFVDRKYNYEYDKYFYDINIYDYLSANNIENSLYSNPKHLFFLNNNSSNQSELLSSINPSEICIQNNISINNIDINWNSFSANQNNTGTCNHPAFINSNDIVYWDNTISLSNDFVIPRYSTVIIKSGTKIKAHTGSSIIVYGTLIAEGIEYCPIEFKANIRGADKNYWDGIVLKNRSTSSFKYCNFSNAV